MKSTPAYLVRSCAMWLNADVKVGQVKELMIPSFKVNTEKMQNAGMVMARDVPVGGFVREPAKFKMPGLDPATIGAINAMPGSGDTLMFTGALKDEDGTINNLTAYMRGFLSEVDFGALDEGKLNDQSYQFIWEYLKVEIGGSTVLEADDFNVSIGGVSQTDDIRAALLLS